jgi:hypothetical protein
MKQHVLIAILAAAGLGLASSAHAYEFRVRFGTQVGDVFTPGTQRSDGSWEIALSGVPAATRIRIQFGVFDDASGPAPAGG